MRYILAALGGLLAFAVTFIAGALVLVLVARPLNDVQLRIGLIGVNLTVVVSALLAAVAATYTVKASLKH